MVKSVIKIKEYKKNDCLLYSRDICNVITHIITGVSRMYYLDENGNEFTCQISFNPNNPILLNQFAVDFNSFISQAPSRYFIEALSDLSVLEISYDDFKILVEKIPSFRELESKINRMITGILRDDLIDINVLSNDERYDKFLDRYKKLPIKIPQYIIASYLGITPAALSRLKKRQ